MPEQAGPEWMEGWSQEKLDSVNKQGEKLAMFFQENDINPKGINTITAALSTAYSRFREFSEMLLNTGMEHNQLGGFQKNLYEMRTLFEVANDKNNKSNKNL